MLAIERQRMILDKVNNEGSVLVKDLAEAFCVSKDSIRKDLTILEEKNLLKKSYGGAVKIRANLHENVAAQRLGQNTKEKKIISEKAFNLIKDDAVIYLDMSTVNIFLAKKIALSGKRLTVVTTMRDIVRELQESSNVNLIVVGGTLNDTKEGFVGSLTNDQLRKFQFDYSFMGVVGVNLDEDRICTYEPDDALTKKTAVLSSSSSYLMLETRKFFLSGNYTYAKIKDMTGIITEKSLPKKEEDFLRQLGLEII